MTKYSFPEMVIRGPVPRAHHGRESIFDGGGEGFYGTETTSKIYPEVAARARARGV